MYKVIKSKRWRNTVTGRTASIYGAVPYVSKEDEKNWIIETVGFTVLHTKTNIVGVGKRPEKTFDDAQDLADRLNRLSHA